MYIIRENTVSFALTEPYASVEGHIVEITDIRELHYISRTYSHFLIYIHDFYLIYLRHTLIHITIFRLH